MAHLTILTHLNGIFHANFAPCPQKGNTRDFLSQVWKVKIFFPHRGKCRRGQNDYFSAKIANLVILILLNGIFHAYFPSWPQESNTRDFLSHVWEFKSLSPGKRRLWKWPKMTIFEPKSYIQVWERMEGKKTKSIGMVQISYPSAPKYTYNIDLTLLKRHSTLFWHF